MCAPVLITPGFIRGKRLNPSKWVLTHYHDATLFLVPQHLRKPISFHKLLALIFKRMAATMRFLTKKVFLNIWQSRFTH